MDLSVKLEIYEGPLDLLLHLIKKNEVDIYDIPISLVTNQYLEYLELMETLNIELAGEFLVMAATLTQIKSRMLLPVTEKDDEEREEDPRLALIRPLVEHMKIRDAAEKLGNREMLDRDVFSRPASIKEMGLKKEEQTVKVNLFELFESFRQILSNLDASADLKITLESKSLDVRISEIIDLLKLKSPLIFEELFTDDRSKEEMILTFLTILELSRIGIIGLMQDMVLKKITINYLANEEEKNLAQT